jgi:acyl carrier protein
VYRSLLGNYLSTKEVVIDFFKQNTNKNIKNDVNYFDEDYIDSLGVFELISTFEEQFGIEFTDDDFENQNFVIINGLIDIIEKKLNNV